ncbi:MAG: VWA domain-containing protein [Bryobacteraceae bacterium]
MPMPHFRFSTFVIIGVLTSSLPTNGQAPRSAVPDAPQFRGSVELVEVPVSVSDRNRRPVTDLSVEDFDVLERGRPQTVSMFEKISIPSATSMRNSLTIPRDVATNHFPANTRAFIIIIDDVHIQLQRTQAARMLVRQFIERHVEQFDLVALVTTSNQFGMVQDFTTDKARLLALVDRFTGLMPAGAASEDRAFLNDVYDAQATANAIARFARHLAHENRHRIALILVSEGIEYNIYDADDRRSVDVVRATDEAIKALRRANVTLYAIDPRGLASVEGDRLERFDTSADAPSRVRITTSVTAPGARERLALSLQSLTHMAERTGGFAAINTNDYHGAFTRIIEETGTYYLLAYYPNPVGRTGEFRDIEVKVRRPDVYVSARQGYVVNQTRNGQKNSESSGQPSTGHLLKVLASALPKPDLPLRVQTIPLHGDHGRARVQVIVEVPGREFFPGPNAKAVEQVQFGLLTIDERGRKENGMSARIELRLTADERERVKLTGVRWLTSLELWPGRYHFRIAARGCPIGC